MKRLVILICFLGILPVAFAQSVQVTANAPKVVGVGDQFQLDFSLNAEPTNYVLPKLADFRILYGPSSSTSTQINMINGKVNQSTTISYSYGLQALKAGKYIIGPAEFTVGGKRYKSNQIEIEVVGNASANAQAKSQSSSASSGSQNEQVSTDGDIFIKVLVDKKNVVQGEYITATVKLYTKYSISSVDKLVYPAFADFFKQEIETPAGRLVEENVNGVVYGTAVIQKFILIPQRSGELKIDPMTFNCMIQQRAQRRSRSIFDDFFGGGVQDVPRNLKSKPVTINVRPLPSNKPASFAGTVGKFTFDANVDKTTAKTNDAITLKVNISGTGNIKLIEAPKISFPPDFDKYDPKVTLNTKASDGGVSGTKTFEYLIIPRNPGNFKLTPISFSYFDVGANQYKTLSSKEFDFTIEKGSSTQNTTIVSGLSKEDVKFLGKDILFIKTSNFNLKKVNHYFFGSIWFDFIYALGLLGFIVIVWFRRRVIQQNANLALMRNRRADKFASKRLKQAKIHLAANEKAKFYDELLKGIWGYLSDKLNIPLSELSRDTACEIFTKREVDQGTVELFIQLVDNCEYAHYAPDSSGISLQDDYNKAIDLISKLQHKLR
jgi:hypothetical protein